MAFFAIAAIAAGQPTPADVGKAIGPHSVRPPIGDADRRPTDSPAQAAARALLETRGQPRMVAPTYYGASGPPREIDGKTETVGIDIVDTYGDQAFPPEQLAIVGSVIDANSYLSVTRDFVYSDFNVKVEEVLRQDKGDTVRAGDTLTTWRRGGAIRFGSGHVMDFVTSGKGFPITGERYVFFLWGRWPDMHGRYEISTAYQLTGGVAQGLDRAFSGYDNVPEEQFPETVKAAIASPKTSPKK